YVSFVIQPGYTPPSVNLSGFIQQEYDIRYEEEQYVVYVGDEVFAEFATKEQMEDVGFVTMEGF
uniref:hypothetical protein n=1 Tax=Anaerotignum sp. TaxID=2039241 RepID=UPI0037359901